MSCPFGKETENQCTPSRADDCGSKPECRVWEDRYPTRLRRQVIDTMVGYGSQCQCDGCKEQQGRVVSAANFVGTLAANVDNKELSDKDFRQMVRNTLPIVRYESGRIPLFGEKK